MLPYCGDSGVAVIPWSPLARGRLTRDWDDSTSRSETDEFGKHLYRDDDAKIAERVAEVAAARGVTRAQVALAWVLRHPAVASPIVGVTKQAHLDNALSAVELALTDEEVDRIRSEERRVGKECVSTCRSRWTPDH